MKYAAIYDVVRQIPRGKIASYGQIADLAGIPGHARQVGYALHALQEPTNVPWHRVINAKATISPRNDLSAGELHQQFRLEDEGVVFDPNGKTSFERFGWKPRLRLGRPARGRRRPSEARPIGEGLPARFALSEGSGPPPKKTKPVSKPAPGTKTLVKPVAAETKTPGAKVKKATPKSPGKQASAQIKTSELKARETATKSSAKPSIQRKTRPSKAKKTVPKQATAETKAPVSKPKKAAVTKTKAPVSKPKKATSTPVKAPVSKPKKAAGIGKSTANR